MCHAICLTTVLSVLVDRWAARGQRRKKALLGYLLPTATLWQTTATSSLTCLCLPPYLFSHTPHLGNNNVVRLLVGHVFRDLLHLPYSSCARCHRFLGAVIIPARARSGDRRRRRLPPTSTFNNTAAPQQHACAATNFFSPSCLSLAVYYTYTTLLPYNYWL